MVKCIFVNLVITMSALTILYCKLHLNVFGCLKSPLSKHSDTLEAKTNTTFCVVCIIVEVEWTSSLEFFEIVRIFIDEFTSCETRNRNKRKKNNFNRFLFKRPATSIIQIVSNTAQKPYRLSINLLLAAYKCITFVLNHTY